MKLKSEIAERIGHFRQQLIIQPWIPVEEMPLIFTLFSKCLRFLLWIYINARKGKRMKRQSKKNNTKKKEKKGKRISRMKFSSHITMLYIIHLGISKLGKCGRLCIYITRLSAHHNSPARHHSRHNTGESALG